MLPKLLMTYPFRDKCKRDLQVLQRKRLTSEPIESIAFLCEITEFLCNPSDYAVPRCLRIELMQFRLCIFNPFTKKQVFRKQSLH